MPSTPSPSISTAPAQDALPSAWRRRMLGQALAWPLAALTGCAAPWPAVPAGPGSTSALARLRESAEAHGLAGWRALRDVNLGFDHLPWPAARGLQPGGAAQMRLLPKQGTVALQADKPDPGATPLAASLHRLLVLGPLALADFDGLVNWAEPVTLDGRRCDHLHLPLAPGLGGMVADRLSLFIDRDDLLLRRLQVSLTALDRADIATVDMAGHQRLHGVIWPRRFATVTSALLGGTPPLAWRLTGLDVDRGYSPEAVATRPWAGRAASPATLLQPV